MEKTVVLAAIAVIYAIVGTVCRLWPEWLQKVAIRKSEAARTRHPLVTRLIESPHYVLYLQVVGAISASASVAITLFLLERAKQGS
jgi:hypothetical protein